MNNYRKSTRIYFMEDIKKQQAQDKKEQYTGVERNKDLENKKTPSTIKKKSKIIIK
jgi:hypothetical protein